MAQYDVVIIGAGPGGYNAAIRAGQLGLKVACVERGKTLGGTCLNVGCMPSKALLHASELFEKAKTEFGTLGIEVEPKLNLKQMMAQKAESVAGLTKGVEFLFRKNKVDWLKGSGRIAGPNTSTSSTVPVTCSCWTPGTAARSISSSSEVPVGAHEAIPTIAASPSRLCHRVLLILRSPSRASAWAAARRPRRPR